MKLKVSTVRKHKTQQYHKKTSLGCFPFRPVTTENDWYLFISLFLTIPLSYIKNSVNVTTHKGDTTFQSHCYGGFYNL